MAEPSNLVFEHLRAIRAEMERMAGWMQTISDEMTAIRQHLAAATKMEEPPQPSSC
ncbi:MAG TPA: hypothetical protein VF744_01330 [Beijerinckiaceae bacterium]|jgi:hypothetical protein